MAETAKFDGLPRERTGKGGARELRRQGRVPAIIYGGSGEPLKVSLLFKDVKHALGHNPRFFSTTYDIDVSGHIEHVLPREVQTHPVNDDPLHLDFLRAEKGATISVAVPVNFENEDECPGVRRGGVLNIVRREIELNCPADNIPAQVNVDLKGYDINDTIHISHVTLPPNVSLTIQDRDFTIASIATPTDTPEDEGEEAEGSGEEGEAEG